MGATEIGRLRRRLVIEQPVEVPDGAGGFTRTWVGCAKVWAAIEPAAARFTFATDRTGQTITHRILMRWRDDLTTHHRLRDGTRLYDLRSVEDADGKKIFLVAHVEETRP